MGDVASQAKSIIQTIREVAAPGASVAIAVAQDPAFKPFIQRLTTLKAMEEKKASKKPSGPPAKGVGLGAFLPLMDAVIVTKRYPWALPVGLIALVGIPLALGYRLGQRRRG